MVGAPGTTSPDRLDAELYDARGIGWPGELECYRRLADAEGCTSADGRGVLEVACGTGRVALDLAAHGCRVIGFDRSPEMIAIARSKTPAGGPRWSVADMRTFRLRERFGLALLPGHAFQFMLTADDQVTALERIRHHLVPGGLLCVHLDHPSVDWLAALPAVPGDPASGRTVTHPDDGRRFRLAHAWTYERATQTATVHMAWERLGPSDQVIERLPLAPMPLHVVGRVEMEHALQRARLEVEALHGDFAGGPFTDTSPEMLWFARRPLRR